MLNKEAYAICDKDGTVLHVGLKRLQTVTNFLEYYRGLDVLKDQAALLNAWIDVTLNQGLSIKRIKIAVMDDG